MERNNKYRLINLIEEEGDDPFGDPPYIFISFDHKSVFSSYKDNSLIQLDINTGKKLSTLIPIDKEAGSDYTENKVQFSISFDRKYCISYFFKGPLKIWDVESQKVIWELKNEVLYEPIDEIFFMKLNMKILYEDDDIYLNSYESFLFSTDNRYIIANCVGVLHIWDLLEQGKVRKIYSGGRAFAISPDNQYVLGAREDFDIIMYNIETGEIIQEFQGHKDYVQFLAFTPDSKSIISVSNDNTIKVWDINTGDILKEFIIYDPQKRTDKDWINTGILSPDGKYICVPTDVSLKIWDLNENTLFQELKFPNIKYITGNLFCSLSFSQDGSILAMSEGKRIYIWKRKVK